MERMGVLAAILLVLVAARVPDASSRVLMADGRGDGKPNPEKVSPSPSPSPNPSPESNISCHSSSEKCHKGELIACLQHPENDSKVLLLLVQNTGVNNMTVKIDITRPIKTNGEEMQIAKGNTTKISINATKGLEIVLHAGNDKCTLHTDPAFDWNPFQRLPAFATHLTPIYGAYFLFVTMVIFGGTWACCKLRRGGRADTRIPYQQLEMGTQTQSASAVIGSNTADDWDEGWDEDWDEEAAPQPSEKRTTRSVSANGLTSRSPRKDGWDVDWDE